MISTSKITLLLAPLALLALQLHQAVAADLMYGDIIYLQSLNMKLRWLSGGRSTNNLAAKTYNLLTQRPNDSAFRWIVRSTLGSGEFDEAEPNAGSCVKYGDKIILQISNRKSRWLACCDLSKAMTDRGLDRSTKLRRYEWIIRNDPGDGVRDYDQDPAQGQCVNYLNKVYLQSNARESAWVTGARSDGNSIVFIRNMYGEGGASPGYQWAVRSDIGSGELGYNDYTFPPSLPPTPMPVERPTLPPSITPVIRASGFWQLVQTGSPGISYSYVRGVRQGTATTDTQSIKEEVLRGRTNGVSLDTRLTLGWTSEVSAGFLGSGASSTFSAEYSVGVGQSSSFTMSTSTALSTSNSVTQSVDSYNEKGCTQSCDSSGVSPTAYIWSWVHVLYDEANEETYAIVDTCNSWCLSRQGEPLCPPGQCGDFECTYCLEGTFLNPELDALASSPTPAPETTVPTTAPTKPPTQLRPEPPTSAPPSSSDACYSSDSVVSLLRKGRTSISHLLVGDEVLTNHGIYEKVYGFGHHAPYTHGTFLQLFTSSMDTEKAPLELTGNHLVFIKDKSTSQPKAIRADRVRVGDVLFHHTQPTEVTYVGTVTKQGLYMPLTQSGTIIVNGIVGSAYVSAQDIAPKIVDIAGTYFGMEEQQLLHWWLSPLRVICAVADCSRESATNSNGIHYWLVVAKKIAETTENWHPAFQVLVVALPLFLVGALFNAAEVIILSNPPNALSLLSAFIVGVFAIRKRGSRSSLKE